LLFENKILLTSWSPQGGGWLTGKYSAANRLRGATRLGEDPNRGVEAYDIRSTDRTYRILDVVETIGTRHARPMTHVALAWLLALPGVSSVLLGARDVDQLQVSMDAYDFTLEPAEMAALSLASSNDPLHYPYNFLEEWCDIDVWKRLQGKVGI
jgi:aryl-alcohol dehydrogenase-like predicted oxidoreductase